ncbi:hypothetical protein D5R40_29585 [Okeania hirsuta]|uniref:Uncharacterized protein n=1 Tax=Okeania hirsuta TaxID=1458930 RepID=A0A3N6NZQ9_9CYAN|nr:hypothetical protein [Okeania hirsuta]RQH24998.1 hypothetical protein D5R40_29585 [Okeania hirsuta]
MSCLTNLESVQRKLSAMQGFSFSKVFGSNCHCGCSHRFKNSSGRLKALESNKAFWISLYNKASACALKEEEMFSFSLVLNSSSEDLAQAQTLVKELWLSSPFATLDT